MLDGINYWEELKDSLSQMDSITSSSSQTLIMHWNGKRGSECFDPVGLDYSIAPCRACGLRSSLSDDLSEVRYQPADWLRLSALSRLIPRCRWGEVFPVTPATLFARIERRNIVSVLISEYHRAA